MGADLHKHMHTHASDVDPLIAQKQVHVTRLASLVHHFSPDGPVWQPGQEYTTTAQPLKLADYADYVDSAEYGLFHTTTSSLIGPAQQTTAWYFCSVYVGRHSPPYVSTLPAAIPLSGCRHGAHASLFFQPPSLGIKQTTRQSNQPARADTVLH